MKSREKMLKMLRATPEIKRTKDLNQFKFLDGNRLIKDYHLTSLLESFKENGPFSWIMYVNEKMEIIDGQHRFLVHKELNLPIFYTIRSGWGLEECQILNQDANNWKFPDFLQSYVTQGKKEYETFKFFKEKYKFLSYPAAIMLLTGGDYIKSRKENRKIFETGDLKITSYEYADRIATYLNDIIEYDSNKLHKTEKFQTAFVKIANLPEYDHERMMKCIRRQSMALSKQTAVKEYIMLLENIYNHSYSTKVTWYNDYINNKLNKRNVRRITSTVRN